MTVTATARHTAVVTLLDEVGAEVNKDQWNGIAAHEVVISGLGSAAEAATTDFDAAGAATAAVAAHEAALTDIHPQYQKESEKDAANGYAGLSAGTKLAGAQQTYGSAANTACEGNDSRLSDSRAPSGSASGDLGGTYPSPTVTQARGLRETAGPTTLVVGAVADGEFLKRVGAELVGGTPAGGSANIKSTEIDFGATPVNYGVFAITDADVSAASNIGIWLSQEAPTGRDADEAEMEPMDCKAADMGSGTFNAVVQPWHGPVDGKYKLNYLVG